MTAKEKIMQLDQNHEVVVLADLSSAGYPSASASDNLRNIYLHAVRMGRLVCVNFYAATNNSTTNGSAYFTYSGLLPAPMPPSSGTRSKPFTVLNGTTNANMSIDGTGEVRVELGENGGLGVQQVLQGSLCYITKE